MVAPTIPEGYIPLCRGVLKRATRSASTTSESFDYPIGDQVLADQVAFAAQLTRDVGQPISKPIDISITSGSIDTPMTHNSHGTDEGYKKVEYEKEAVAQELEGHVYFDENFGKTAFVGKVASNEKIQEFLLSCDLYDSVACRWRDVPENPSRESELYDPFAAILTDIVGHFYPSSEGDHSEPTSRVVIDTHNVNLKHHLGIMDGGRVGKTSPDATIQGAGRNFPPLSARDPRLLYRAAYLRCATPLEIKLDTKTDYMSNLVQVGVYARQCFMVQGNRFFVYSMIITEKHAQLYVFDRSGVYHSRNFDIHKQAVDFVRFILGVSSTDDTVIGFTRTSTGKESAGSWKSSTKKASSKNTTYKTKSFSTVGPFAAVGHAAG
ncbi:hypothetical protein M413DRAFT_113985 [Hebeloma cylindrosporum]|uniref:Fungal-type protein kinase domain-containing protein n=1 Tax=Hebeloma cylindrosporum TaxID=76867 RepID=A0A0C2YIU3_HEBCY|nr:hypothetical protein M413DRAFT_113985 [Hebeloma cylindrosporum h7]